MWGTLGAIIASVSELITLGFKVRALYLEAQKRGWVKDGRALSVAISEAKTDEEREELARILFKHRAN